METSQDIRTLFLQEFIKRLIIKSLPKPQKIEKEEPLFEKLEKVAAKIPELEITKQQEEKKPEIKKPVESTESLKPIVSPQIQPSTPSIQILPQIPEKTSITVIDKLKPILADPAVQVINCPGPNQNIFVTRLGMVQKLPLSFTKGEIDSFMKDVSEKTRIPLLPGLFKVIFQNLLITAVVSEFIGTKFIIEKRLLAQPLSPQMQIRAQFR